MLRRGVGSIRNRARGVRSWSRTLGGRLWILTVALGTLLIGVAALVGLSAWFLREPPVRTVHELDGKPTPFAIASPGFAAAAEIAARIQLAPGAAIEVLNDGDQTFPRLWADLRAARRSITIVNYYSASGAVTDTLALILKERAAAGVPVYFVYDPIGSIDLERTWLDDLRAHHVRVAEYHPVRWYRLDRLQHRTHVRAIVIDGQIGYTGGFGFADYWLGNGRSSGQWRDVNARITGPPARQLQAAFVYTWVGATGELLAGDLLFEPAPADSTAREPDAASHAGATAKAGIMISPATIGSSSAERMLALSIATARRTLYVSNAYFIPDADFVALLRDAAARGVDVRILTNSHRSDVPLTWLAGRQRYSALLEGGVRIYEYQPTVLHSKTLVADGVWVSIGTVNIDNRSLAFNDEVSLLVLDAELGARMDSLFFADTEASIEIRLDAFRRRSIGLKLLERVADLVSRWL